MSINSGKKNDFENDLLIYFTVSAGLGHYRPILKYDIYYLPFIIGSELEIIRSVRFP
jgi:hypothetical protein